MIHVTLVNDGRVLNLPQGITGQAILEQAQPPLPSPSLGMEINGSVYGLSHRVEADVTIRFLTWEDEKGKQIFWHSSAHLLAAALQHIYPNIQLTIGPPVAQGFYYDVDLNGHTLLPEELAKIEAKIITLAAKKSPFIARVVSKQDAMDWFIQQKNPYKLELIEGLEDGSITFYQQGDFTDLCKGPHLPHTGFIKAVKILNLSGAYWRGNIHQKQLTRIYAITFPEKKLLTHFLTQQEEAKKRSHQKLGQTLGLFTFSEKVGLGLPLWLPKGAILCDQLIQFLKQEQVKRGYQPIITPHIGHKKLYVTSGHYEKYQEDCFQPIHTSTPEECYLLKPMNCPHHCEVYGHIPRSYKELPLRFAEFGTVYRYELHGALHGLTRTRCFTQDDAHIFCRLDQVKQELAEVIDLVLYVLKVFKFSDYKARLSFRDPLADKYIGTQEAWDLAEQAIQDITAEKGLPTTLALGEAAFYGPKVDFIVQDALGRNWQLGTIQLDYQLPARFKLTYTGSDGQNEQPVMIHRAPFGSLERFIAILLEHTAGRLPFWLAPEQVIVLVLSDQYLDYANMIHQRLLDQHIRSSLDARNETLGKKIREAELKKIPYLAIIGKQELESNLVTLRKPGGGGQFSMTLDQFVADLVSHNMPQV